MNQNNTTLKKKESLLSWSLHSSEGKMQKINTQAISHILYNNIRHTEHWASNSPEDWPQLLYLQNGFAGWLGSSVIQKSAVLSTLHHCCLQFKSIIPYHCYHYLYIASSGKQSQTRKENYLTLLTPIPERGKIKPEAKSIIVPKNNELTMKQNLSFK